MNELRNKYPLNSLLQLTNMSKSTFYFRLNKLLHSADKYKVEKELIKEIFSKNKQRYGHRRITAVLRYHYGIVINHKTVNKLMKELNLKVPIKKVKYHSYMGTLGKIKDNILNREFTADKPNQKWVTDVTMFKVLDTKLYLSPILDLFNSEIISYTVSKSPNIELVQSMLNNALKTNNNVKNLIFHSDLGWQYQMKEFQRTLTKHNIIQSMSNKGNCLDNAVMENFFGRLKTEFFYQEKFKSVDEFIDKLHEYIYYYNNIRIKEKLNWLSPVQYKLKTTH